MSNIHPFNTNQTQPPLSQTDEKRKYYGVDFHANYVRSLKIIFRDDRAFYLPYNLNLIIDYHPDKGIYINTEDYKLVITGRNLDDLADGLGMYKVTWIKESTTGYGLEDGKIFIQHIKLNKTQ